MTSDQEILRDYWDAQAQFGPFEVEPDEFLRLTQEEQGRVVEPAERAKAVQKSLGIGVPNG